MVADWDSVKGCKLASWRRTTVLEPRYAGKLKRFQAAPYRFAGAQPGDNGGFFAERQVALGCDVIGATDF